MLKWAVLPRRDQEKQPETPKSASKSRKRRRSSARRTSSPRMDKENQFTSTPIKSADAHLSKFDAFRDVSNLTPTRADKRHKKKKRCVDPGAHSASYFKNFETVDSHIQSVILENCDNCHAYAAPTLPTYGMDYSPCLMGLDVLDEKHELATNDSSFINDLSLDEIVNAILDTSGGGASRKHFPSYDSGFSKSSSCACANSNDNVTIINVDETFNERCVDAPNPRKRQAEEDGQDCCTLKRQKCVRRRKNLKNKAAPQAAESPKTTKRFRRCLTFDSPKADEPNGLSGACMDLEIRYAPNELTLNVIRCRDLYRALGRPVNAYVKVSLSEGGDPKKRGSKTLRRTAVQADSTRPFFNQTFKFPIGGDEEDEERRLHVDVWHRDRTTRTSEFLGCMSFPVKNDTEQTVSGTFSLLPQASCRPQGAPMMTTTTQQEFAGNMGELSRSSAEEIMSLEEIENDLKKTTSRTALTEQQKHADENLFLRYLELDPVEGPNAIPAALQRRATGNKNGRTPFTQTKRLSRAPKTGFGFSVVWTHPPRIERVEKGLPADKAGILPGDYIIFVDKHNVVMTPEIDILNLIRSYGSQLTLEIFRRNSSRNGSVPGAVLRVNSAGTSSTGGLPLATNLAQRRPSTVCSTNTASLEFGRKKLHLPQVTFSSEMHVSNPEDNRRKTMFQLIAKEQQYATCLQFAVTRFVAPLLERHELITPAEHRTLFQNCEEILRVTEDLLDLIIPEDGEAQTHLLVRAYYSRLYEITTLYKRYCSGIKKADCVLANKTKNSNSEFVRFVQTPAVPRRRPDITTFIHKPLEHFREVLKLLTVIQSHTKHNHEDYSVINNVVHDLQSTYREITAEGGLMEPLGEGRPLLTVQDLENRLVFTKCKPFVLSKPGRQWIFGGDLGRVEGRNVRQYWTLLFSDLLLFAKVSRDRVLFIMEEPLPLINVTDIFFNIRKKDTEFRITVVPGGRAASSPTVHCGPELTRTPRKNASKRTFILRAPSLELKAVWQNLLQRQIFHVNAGMDGSSFSSPLESPDAPITSSVATLQSAESFSFRRQGAANPETHKLIERKCKLLGKTDTDKGNAIHLEQWMKGQLDFGQTHEPDADRPAEEWTAEMLRKRSQELQLIDSRGNVKTRGGGDARANAAARCEEACLSDEQSPSKSTTTESQVTVRSSPLVPETVQVCRQCHKNCLTANENHPTDVNDNRDPFAVPTPRIAVATAPARKCKCEHEVEEEELMENSPDDSPRTEEHPYHSLDSSNLTLRRFGTVSSLERLEALEDCNKFSPDSEDFCNDAYDLHGFDNEAFSHQQPSIMSWTTAKASFFEEGGKIFERYLKAAVDPVNGGDDYQEEETSGATSGEEVWGTPTSGGELDDPLSSPKYDGKQSPNDGSMSSEYDEDTELMMDELLMAPPVSGATLRGLLPRRTLEPLIEEDISESYSSTSDSPTPTEPSLSPEQDKGTGNAADTCSGGAGGGDGGGVAAPTTPVVATRSPTGDLVSETRTKTPAATAGMRRAESYRRILEAEEDGGGACAADGDAVPFGRFRAAARIGGVRRVRAVKIFEFFNVRRETFPEEARSVKVFGDESASEDDSSGQSNKSTSPRRLKDKQLDRRFWKQLTKRRGIKLAPPTTNNPA